MKKIKIIDLFLESIMAQHTNDPHSLIKEIIADQSRDTAFWFVCKEVAFETLQKNSKWYQLSFQIDDRKLVVEDEIVKNLPKWIEKQMAINNYLDSIENLLKWLFERYINMLKNTTNETYKIYTRLDIVEFNDEKSYADDISTTDKIILDSFQGYEKAEKIAILTKIWNDTWDDFEFDLLDLEYLCEKYNAPRPSTFVEIKQKIQVKTVKDNNGNHQLLIDFQD